MSEVSAPDVQATFLGLDGIESLILEVKAGRGFALKVGRLLNQVRPLFDRDDPESFLAWSEQVCGLKKSATYRYMQAADVVARVPATADLTGSTSTLAWLARFPDREIETLIKHPIVKRAPTLANVRFAAVWAKWKV